MHLVSTDLPQSYWSRSLKDALKYHLQQYVQTVLPLIFLAFPVIVNNLLSTANTFITLGSIGHHSYLEFVSVGLGLIWMNMTGVSVCWGINSALDTFSSQAFGAGNSQKVGLLIQRAIVLNACLYLVITLIWFNTESIFLVLQQDPQVSQLCGHLMKVLSCGFWIYFLFETLRRWLQAQRITSPALWCGLSGLLATILGNYVFVFVFKLGITGTAISIICSWLGNLVHLLVYIWWTGIWKTTWPGLSMQVFGGWKEYLSLAIPGLIMFCSEWWCYEIAILLAGMVGTLELAAFTVCTNTLNLCFMIPAGIGQALATEVGNSLGAQKYQEAKKAVVISLYTGIAIQICSALGLLILRKQWGNIFTDDEDVIALVGRILPFVCVVTMIDGILAMYAGPIRGAGKQNFGAVLNLIGYYLIALPTSVFLCFYQDLDLTGLWLGLVLGPFVIMAIFTYFLFYWLDWEDLALDKAASARLNSTVPPGVMPNPEKPSVAAV
eukprot:TRINITY_DN5755_c0_g1_i2.p1 TRINITY_DN5755_c0_g1~~TRINITY_DN5755_c0_g1_i2.p1  ORF type:complete len:494 (-),score=33.77 TRINITY_DN5755_c0_g1_i2:37-1518(-)